MRSGSSYTKGPCSLSTMVSLISKQLDWMRCKVMARLKLSLFLLFAYRGALLRVMTEQLIGRITCPSTECAIAHFRGNFELKYLNS